MQCVIVNAGLAIERNKNVIVRKFLRGIYHEQKPQ